jgi:hypothetical protein
MSGRGAVADGAPEEGPGDWPIRAYGGSVPVRPD